MRREPAYLDATIAADASVSAAVVVGWAEAGLVWVPENFVGGDLVFRAPDGSSSTATYRRIRRRLADGTHELARIANPQAGDWHALPPEVFHAPTIKVEVVEPDTDDAKTGPTAQAFLVSMRS